MVSAAHWKPPRPNFPVNADVGVRRDCLIQLRLVTYLTTVWLPASGRGVAFPFYIVLFLLWAVRLLNLYVNNNCIIIIIIIIITLDI
jgi:hypothetical protein